MSYYFTFWQLVRQTNGTYLACPHLHIYPQQGFFEIINRGAPRREASA